MPHRTLSTAIVAAMAFLAVACTGSGRDSRPTGVVFAIDDTTMAKGRTDTLRLGHIYPGEIVQKEFSIVNNTDKPIDKLLEADVYYTKQDYSYSFAVGAGEHETFGEKSDEYAYLKYTDKVEHTGDGLFAGTYKWDRIETVEQFIAENDLTQNVYSGAVIDVNVANKITDEGKAALQSKKWVLRFAETSYSLGGGYGSTYSFSTLVGDVTILRLKFETDGVTYNLGVIDNKQSGSDKPINEEEIQPEINNRGLWIIIAIILIVALILLAPLLPTIISFLLKVIVWIFKGLWWLISAPFRLIKTIIEKIKEKRG